ncbi:MAG TPA: hypothetical protein VJ909_06240 [Prolixibacteraceae bacterium]|nr:hypothetical protein [Prolixibacteraceae bacterium]
MNIFKSFATIMLLFSITMLCHANTNNFDESEIYSAFNEISEATEFIESTNASYADLEANGFSASAIANTAAIATSMQDENMEPPVLSAFWWGCLTGPVGIVVVAVTTDNNKEQIKKSVFGCAIPTGCSALSWIAYYALYATAATSYY